MFLLLNVLLLQVTSSNLLMKQIGSAARGHLFFSNVSKLLMCNKIKVVVHCALDLLLRVSNVTGN